MTEPRAFVQARQPLLTAINLVAPTGKNQKAFVDLIHELEEEGRDPEDIFKRLVGALWDGLAYGNWIPSK